MPTRLSMTVSDESRHTHGSSSPHRRHDLHVEELDGEAVLYDPRNGAIHRFNSTTFEVWRLCDGTQMLKSIACRVEERYSVSADEALAIVRSVLADLRDKGLLKDEEAGSGSFAEQLKRDLAPVDANDQTRTTTASRSASSATCSTILETGGRELSRRELLGGGATKAMLAAPVISTFFAAGAYASGPSASGAFGTDIGGPCKTIGYSCAVNADCCGFQENKARCQADVCCIKSGEAGCVDDVDCCEYPAETCDAGVCN